MCCGSNSYTDPTRFRSPAVSTHTSGLLLVATTVPGAAMMSGTTLAEVLLLRGPQITSSTSSWDLNRVAPDTSPSAAPISRAESALVLVSASDGRKPCARLAISGCCRSANALRETIACSPLRGRRRRVTSTATATVAANTSTACTDSVP